MTMDKSLKLSPDNIHTKTCLPTDSYSMTITQGYLHPKKEDPLLVLCHTVDTGQFAYQHALAKFNLVTNSGQARLKKMCNGIGFVWFVEDVYDEMFPEQFIAQRALCQVKQTMDTRKKIIRNDIIEWSPITTPPEYNVMKERSDEHFNETEQHGEPDLPL